MIEFFKIIQLKNGSKILICKWINQATDNGDKISQSDYVNGNNTKRGRDCFMKKLDGFVKPRTCHRGSWGQRKKVPVCGCIPG